MTMTEEQKEILRSSILMQLHAAYPQPMLNTEILHNTKVISSVRDLDQPTLDDHLRYLEGKRLIERPLIGGALRRYLLTDTGRAWLDERNLI